MTATSGSSGRYRFLHHRHRIRFKPLAEFSEQLRVKAVSIPGIVDVDTTLRLDKPELLARTIVNERVLLGLMLKR
ncbi:MAG: hypothetical protein U0892_08065 [Pirellulales bacterium]